MSDAHTRPTIPAMKAVRQENADLSGYRYGDQYARFEAARTHLKAAFDLLMEAQTYEKRNIDLDVDLSQDIEEMIAAIGQASDEVQCRGIENVATHAAIEGGAEE